MKRSLASGLVLLGLLVTGLGMAASTTGTPAADNANYSGLIILAAVVYLTRRKAIGGWLAFYFFQLYLIFFVDAETSANTLGNFWPSAWNTSGHYVWFILSLVPAQLAAIAEVALATWLLWKRTQANLERLRRVLLANAISWAFSAWIYFYQLHQTGGMFGLDLIMLIYAVIWCAYFYRSTRVERVFVYHNWVYDGVAPAARSPQEKRYRLRRALIGGAAVFVLALVVSGIVVNGAKKPDPFILFMIPTFYGIVAFGIVWFVPIRKKKLESLLNSVPARAQ